jgi:hypothetical protein
MLYVLVAEQPGLAMESQEDSIDIAKLKRVALGLAVSKTLCHNSLYVVLTSVLFSQPRMLRHPRYL